MATRKAVATRRITGGKGPEKETVIVPGMPPGLTKADFAARIKELLHQKGWSQSDLSKHADIGRDAVSSYVNARYIADAKNLKKMADAFGITVEELFPVKYRSALLNDNTPMLEVRAVPDNPERVWLRVNRIVTLDVAMAVFQQLKAEEAKAAKAAARK
jgi:transcriptional regulator with XRE-family HTH domain